MSGEVSCLVFFFERYSFFPVEVAVSAEGVVEPFYVFEHGVGNFDACVQSLPGVSFGSPTVLRKGRSPAC